MGMVQGTFSVPCSIIYSGITADTRGLFDLMTAEVNPETGATVLVKKPQISLYYPEIVEVFGKEIEEEEGWIIQVSGKTYRVKSVDDYEGGLVVLGLKNA
jgi:hypothetical protein